MSDYFKSRNAVAELHEAVVRGKAIVLVLEGDAAHGGGCVHVCSVAGGGFGGRGRGVTVESCTAALAALRADDRFTVLSR